LMGSAKGRRPSAASPLVWREVTRNHHVAYVAHCEVCAVVRPQRNRRDGTKHDWRVVVLGSMRFDPRDARDLDLMKVYAEKSARRVVESLSRQLKGRA
jgi:hypothetical protein